MEKQIGKSITIKMIDIHNEYINFYRRNCGKSKIEIRNTQVFKDAEYVLKDLDFYNPRYTAEYFYCNIFIIQNFVSKEDLESISRMLKSRDDSTQAIGAILLYDIVEKIKDKLKEYGKDII